MAQWSSRIDQFGVRARLAEMTGWSMVPRRGTQSAVPAPATWVLHMSGTSSNSRNIAAAADGRSGALLDDRAASSARNIETTISRDGADWRHQRP